MNQNTSSIIMIRPKHFDFNKETASNNYFQKEDKSISKNEIRNKAVNEFESLTTLIESRGMEVIVFDDRDDVITTDSVFPNNWVSFHENGNVFIYPMFSKNRRKEKRLDILEELNKKGYLINKTVDLSKYEIENRFLEGTGSMVLDRENKICYAAISERTDIDILSEFCSKNKYEKIAFRSYQTVGNKRKEIYHTNVIMCVADKYSIVCLESIDDIKEKKKVINKLEATNKKIIEITESQCNNFAGNMLQLKNNKNEKFLIMSRSAYDSLSEDQIRTIRTYNEIIYSDIKTIEKLGGGSARCMIAENFLRKK